MNKDFIVLIQKLYNFRSDLTSCMYLLEKNRSYILESFPDLEFSEYMDMIVSLFDSFLYVSDFLVDISPDE